MRPVVSLVAVVGLLVSGTAVASAVGTPREHPGRTDQVDVIGAFAVCPDVIQARGTLASRLSVGAAPAAAGAAPTSGGITAHHVSGPPTPSQIPVTQPGQVAIGLGTTVNENGVVFTASGPFAAGLEVEQVTRGESGPTRGLAGMRCEAPTPEAWFVGGSTGVNDTAYLMLANAEDVPATVDVTVVSASGEADPRLGQGITVDPHTRKVIPLDTLAPDRAYLAVHVQARRGRVAASVRHQRFSRPFPLGVDWVPQTRAGQTLVVPGFPLGHGARRLIIANPGTDDTSVKITVTTGDEQFVPAGLDAFPVSAGHTAVVQLDDLSGSSAFAVTVTSLGGPVVAGALVDDLLDPHVHDIAYTAASAPLSGPALLTDLVINHPTESTLVLTAPEGAASVKITPLRVVGAPGPVPGPKTLSIPAGRTVTFRLSTFFPPGASASLALEVVPMPGSGPIYAARYLREHGAHGPLTTLLDLRGPAQQVSRPAVVQDDQAGYAGP